MMKQSLQELIIAQFTLNVKHMIQEEDMTIIMEFFKYNRPTFLPIYVDQLNHIIYTAVRH